jgi:hypothetical protein
MITSRLHRGAPISTAPGTEPSKLPKSRNRTRPHLVVAVFQQFRDLGSELPGSKLPESLGRSPPYLGVPVL